MLQLELPLSVHCPTFHCSGRFFPAAFANVPSSVFHITVHQRTLSKRQRFICGHTLPTGVDARHMTCVELFITEHIYRPRRHIIQGTGKLIQRELLVNYSLPSTSAPKKSTSGRRVTNMEAFPFIRCKENLWKRWPMATDSSCPVCLPSALPSCFSCWIVTLCIPPSASTAMGMKTRPCSLVLG